MRTSVIASLLGLSLVACAGNISGGGGGDDDDIPETCGNGAVDPGEECDGSAGCSASCTQEAIPRLDISVDKPTVTTELGTSNMVTVTLTSTGGFTGVVPVTGAFVDSSGTVLPEFVVAVNPPSVTVPAGGTATAVVTLGVPSTKTALSGSLRITTTPTGSEGGIHTFDSAVTIVDQFTIPVKLNAGGLCVYPPAGTFRVKVGTKVRWLNDEALGGGGITIHTQAEGAGNGGLGHQPDGPNGTPGSAPQTAYERTATSPATIRWYCHAPGQTVDDLLITIE